MKKNIRKIPDSVLSKLKTITQNDIVVACAKTYRHDDLAKGLMRHLGITVNNQGITFLDAVLPQKTQGKYSDRNINGEVIVRKDLRIETAYHPAEAPNWGDSYYGTHTVYLPHKEYPRDFRPPKELQILVKNIGRTDRSESYVLAFRVDEVLNRTSSQFEQTLLENLNLLQENIGVCGVEPADTPMQDYMRSLHVSWEILPPGSREEVLMRLFRGKTPSTKELKDVQERYDFFTSLTPKQLVVGSSGFRRYFGALLEDNLVVFENVEYGNAVYILYEDWEELSQKTRLELLSGRFGRNFDRIIHKHGWKGIVKNIVRERRKRKTE